MLMISMGFDDNKGIEQLSVVKASKCMAEFHMCWKYHCKHKAYTSSQIQPGSSSSEAITRSSFDSAANLESWLAYIR